MAVHVTSAQFEGPFDLLLHLVEKAQMDIREIALSEITDQYIETLRSGEGINMENTSSFLRIAATLLYIKSRVLLPARKELEDPDEEDAEALLIRQLQEYRRYKQAKQALRELEAQAGGAYCKLPAEVALEPENISIENSDVQALFELFQAVMARKREDTPITEHRVQADRYSVAERAQNIMDALKIKPRLRFDTLIEHTRDRMDAVATFLAVLELMSMGRVRVQQTGAYARIYIQLAKGTEDTVG